MGVIKKKSPHPGRVEPGVRYHCDVCGVDITFTVRIRCSHPSCTEYDLCVTCFSSGGQNNTHNCATHSYLVIEQHSYPIFTDDWGADEELLLLEGAEMYGLGSWADIADHIGGARDKDEVAKHYMDTYIFSKTFPVPEHSDPNDRTFADISRESFQARKKRRIEARKEEAANSTPSAPKKKPTASVPACHEIQGYMPGRMEFETEFDNEAEMVVKDLVFDPGDGINPITGAIEPEVELKLAVMDIYNHKLDQRCHRKKVMLEHNLLEYRKNINLEKKRTKEERDLINKTKPFARIMNKRDYEEFSAGIVHEFTVRQAIQQLQEWRRMGIQTLEAGSKYELEKVHRTDTLRNKLQAPDRLTHRYSSKATPPTETPPINPLTAPKMPTSAPNGTSPGPDSPTPMTNGVKRNGINGVNGINGTAHEVASDFLLLSRAEQRLCYDVRIKPKPYLCIKDRLMQEAIRQKGVLTEKVARDLCKIDSAKIVKIHDFFIKSGWVKQQ